MRCSEYRTAPASSEPAQFTRRLLTRFCLAAFSLILLAWASLAGASAQDLSGRVTASPEEFRAGTDVTFTLTITNLSSETLAQAPASVFSFTVPSGVVEFPGENSCGFVSLGASVITAGPGMTMPPGFSCFAEFLVRVAPDAPEGLFIPEANYTGPHTASLSWATIRILPPMAEPTLVLNATPNPSSVGEAVTFTARLVGAVNPTAPVVFSEGGVALASVALVGDTATFTTDALAVGDHTIRASYAGDADNAAADPVFILQQVLPPTAPTLVLNAAPNPSLVGEAVTFTARLVGAVNPTAPIVFSEGGVELASVALVGDTATFTTDALAVGDHTIRADYAGDADNTAADPVFILQQVLPPTAPTLVLNATPNPSSVGEGVTFTARLVGAVNPTAPIIFSEGGVELASVALAGDTATFTTDALAVGDHTIRADYAGDADNVAADPVFILQRVSGMAGKGSVIFRVESPGRDATFRFSSPTPALNVSVASSGGRGESAPIQVPAGSHVVSFIGANDNAPALSGSACSDADSVANGTSRSVTIQVSPGETVICTFMANDARAATVELIEAFLRQRGQLILANQPGIDRRIDRLNGLGGTGANLPSMLMGYLPGLAEGTPVTFSASLSALDRLAGNTGHDRFDLWVEGTFARYQGLLTDSSFYMATLGADYLVSPDLLVGGFVQLDHLQQTASATDGLASGTGWLAGPYATMRLHEHVYLDLTAGLGLSTNRVSPFGTYQDTFSATRWLVNASLQGQWQSGSWTFGPRARLSYYGETSAAYTDSLGTAIPPVSTGMGQISAGPGISHRAVTNGGITIDTTIRVEGVATVAADRNQDVDITGRIEGAFDLTLPEGASVGFSGGLDGLGAPAQSISGRVQLRIPF